MNKKLVSIIAALTVSIGLVSQASATEAWTTSTITGVFPVGSGYFVLYFESGTSCGGGAATVTVGQNGMTTEGAHMLLSVALTAFTTSKPVQVAYDNATSQCYVNRILMTN